MPRRHKLISRLHAHAGVDVRAPRGSTGVVNAITHTLAIRRRLRPRGALTCDATRPRDLVLATAHTAHTGRVRVRSTAGALRRGVRIEDDIDRIFRRVVADSGQDVVAGIAPEPVPADLCAGIAKHASSRSMHSHSKNTLSLFADLGLGLVASQVITNAPGAAITGRADFVALMPDNRGVVIELKTGYDDGSRSGKGLSMPVEGIPGRIVTIGGLRLPNTYFTLHCLQAAVYTAILEACMPRQRFAAPLIVYAQKKGSTAYTCLPALDSRRSRARLLRDVSVCLQLAV